VAFGAMAHWQHMVRPPLDQLVGKRRIVRIGGYAVTLTRSFLLSTKWSNNR
jgi:hypothetical protein